MKYCPNDDCSHYEDTGERGEFRDDIEACSDCGATLVNEPPPRPQQRLPTSSMPMPDDELIVKLGVYRSESQAAALQEAVEKAGIPVASIVSDIGVMGGLLKETSLFVPQSRVMQAKEIVASYAAPTEELEPFDEAELERIAMETEPEEPEA